ncbi:MAG: alpha/beta hydrolase [Eubacterium sp.]|nr:alpha/beta hydrolase [Eubacterium sp.]
MYLRREEGFDLYYQRRGKGQNILMIHGAVADGDYFDESLELLSNFYDIITYDRRGNSRSGYSGKLNCDIKAQADDAVALIEELDLKDLIIVGHSAGGMVALETFARVVSRVKHVIVYETPMLMLTKDYDPGIEDWVKHMYELNKAGEHRQVAKEFGISIGKLDERAPVKSREEKAKDRRNFAHFINNEFIPFSYYEPDLKFCRANSSYITAIAGDRNFGSTYHRAMCEFSRLTGCRLLHTAGCHNYPYDLAIDFATEIVGIVTMVNAGV